ARRGAGEERSPTTGSAKSAAARGLSAPPAGGRRPRRETGGTGAFERLESAIVVTPRGPRRIRLAGELRSVIDQPSDHVADVAGRERPIARIAAPVGHAERGTAHHDGGAKALIAGQAQVGAVHDRPAAPATGSRQAFACRPPPRH